MEFFSKIFNAIASAAEKASVVDFRIFAIVALALILALGVAVAISYAFTGVAKLRYASKKISKIINNKYKIIDDENVAAFTKECFSEQAPRRLREAWIQYLGVRFGYPSEIISREKVFDREVGANRNIRSVVFIAISLFIIGVLSFFCMGSQYVSKMGVLAGITIIIVSVIHLLFVLAAKIEYKRALKTFEAMQDDLDAATQLQIEKDYAADSSPLSDIASIVDEIIAKNISKDVKEREYANEPAAPIDILLKFNQKLNQEEPPQKTEPEVIEEKPQDEVKEEVKEEVVEETPVQEVIVPAPVLIEEPTQEEEEPEIVEEQPIEEEIKEEEPEIQEETVVEEPVVEEPEPQKEEEPVEVMTNEEPSDIISNVDEIVSSVNEDDNTSIEALIASVQESFNALPEEEKKQVPVCKTEDDISAENIGNAFRDGYKNEQYIKQLDEQIIKEDEDMFGFKKKKAKEAEQPVAEEIVEIEETPIEPIEEEKVDLDHTPQDNGPDMGFSYAEAQALQDAEAKGEEYVEEKPVEEAPAEEVPQEETPVEETPVEEAHEDDIIAQAEEIADEDIEEIAEPSEDDIKAVEMLEAEEAAIDDSDEFTPPKFAKLPQLVNFMCSSSKVSRNVKIKMCIFLLQAFKSFKDKPEEKNIILTCLLKILVSIKMSK